MLHEEVSAPTLNGRLFSRPFFQCLQNISNSGGFLADNRFHLTRAAEFQEKLKEYSYSEEVRSLMVQSLQPNASRLDSGGAENEGTQETCDRHRHHVAPVEHFISIRRARGCNLIPSLPINESIF